MMPNPAVVVAIPACNEAERIGACLAALGAQRDGPRFGILVLANNCTDGTEHEVWAAAESVPALHLVSLSLPPERAHAGEARLLAMNAAAAICAPDGVLLTTDADAYAPPEWIAANLAALRGVDAVAGRAVIDPVEAALIPPHLHELDARECHYAALLDEIAALLTPLPHDPWPRHDEHSGASIAVRLPSYREAGGIPRLRTGEDRAFFGALRACGARIRHAPEVWVTVSGRLDGRAHGGMADTIRGRLKQPPDHLDDRLEPAGDFVQRLLGVHIAPPRRVSFAELDAQTAEATLLRDQLRRQAMVAKERREPRRADSDPCAADE